MGRSVRISEEHARTISAGFRMTPEIRDDAMRAAICALRDVLVRLDRTPKSKPPRKSRHVSFNVAMADLRAQKAVGSCGNCELCLQGDFKRCPNWRGVKSRKPSKQEKRDETDAIRKVCFERAGLLCECGCGQQVRDDRKDGGCYPEARGELDHFFGRGKVKQSVETCWILRADCHREKTLNRPDAATWLRKFIAHCDRNAAVLGLGDLVGQARAEAKKRLAFVETRSALPAAPRTR